MSLRLEQKNLHTSVLVGENSTQTVIEGTIVVRAGEPAVGRALLVRAIPNLGKAVAAEDQVNLEGVLDIEFFYASITETEVASDEDDEATELILEERLEKSVFPGVLPFAFTLDVPGAQSGMTVAALARVESSNFEVHNDQRTVDIDLVVNFSASVSTTEEHEVCQRVIASGEVNLQQQQVRMASAAITSQDHIKVEGFLPFGGRVLPEKVLALFIRPAAPAIVRVSEGFVHVNGPLAANLLYTAQDIGPAQADWVNAAAYQADVAVAGVSAQAKAEVQITPKVVSWQVVDTDEQRGLMFVVELNMQIKAYEVKSVSIVSEISAGEPLLVAFRQENLILQEVVGENSTQTIAEALLELPAGIAPMERILHGEAYLEVEDVHVLGDKVAIEGTASFNLLYVGRSGDATSLATTSWPKSIPVEVEIPITGAEPGLERHVDIEVNHVQIDLISRDSVEVRLELSAKANLWRTVELAAVVEAVEVPQPVTNPASYTFVVIREGDTLWKLAQRYYTDEAALVVANSWLGEQEMQLPVGSKICIPKTKRGVA